MYICLCKQVTDKQINKAIKNGAHTVDAIAMELGASSECGSCIDCLKDMITEHFIDANNIPVLNNINPSVTSTHAMQLNAD